jgi:hypothetical protein
LVWNLLTIARHGTQSRCTLKLFVLNELRVVPSDCFGLILSESSPGQVTTISVNRGARRVVYSIEHIMAFVFFDVTLCAHRCRDRREMRAARPRVSHACRGYCHNCVILAVYDTILDELSAFISMI